MPRSKNGDILKIPPNMLEITSSENPSKIKGFTALCGMVSNDPMGIPQKDLTPSPISPSRRAFRAGQLTTKYIEFT